MKIRMYLEVEEDFKREVKAAAALKGQTINAYTEKALKQQLKKDNKKG